MRHFCSGICYLRAPSLVIAALCFSISGVWLAEVSESYAQREAEPAPSPSNTPVPIPPAPPTQTPECVYYSLNFKHGSTHKDGRLKISPGQGAQSLKCFEDIAKKAFVTCHNKDYGYTQAEGVDLAGNQMMKKYATCFTGHFWKHLLAANNLTSDTYEQNKKYINCATGYGATNYQGHAGEAQIGGGSVRDSQPGCRQGSLYLDNDCKLIPASEITAQTKRCGSIGYYAEMATPISLVWRDDYSLLPSTIVSFKLNPHSSNKMWLWRGSESLPVLVFDPEHTGSITSAEQLFGTWTFGGKKSTTDKPVPATPWQNGYEALATMDTDSDGRIAGTELDKLALWFDANRDGVSQQGEVKRLSEVSVTALFYKADKTDVGALVATKGYERLVDGQVKTYSSVDWLETTVADPLEPLLERTAEPRTSSVLPRNTEVSAGPNTSASNASDLAGVWRWTLKGPAQGEGYFTFDESENGFTGSSISLIGMAGIPGVNGEALFTNFEKISVTARKQGFDVSLLAKSVNGATLSSSADLSADGSALSGKTVVSGSTSSQSGTFEYDWIAERIN